MKHSLLTALLFSCLFTNAQLSIGPSALSIGEGTSFSAGGFVITPSGGTTTIANNLLEKSTTPVNIRYTVFSLTNLTTFINPISITGTVRFYYDPSELNGNTENALKLAYFDGAVWRNTITASVNSAENYIEETLNNQTFNGVTASNYVTPLPVSLISYMAKLLPNKTVLLQWQTASESENSHFSISRSVDRREYQVIGTVQASTVATGSAYSFVDANPGPGNNYYQLRQYDRDGRETIYGVRLIKTGSQTPGLLLYPNPATSGGITVDAGVAVTSPINYQILNAGGQVIKSGKLNTQRQWISITELPAGSYMLSIGNGRSISFQKQ